MTKKETISIYGKFDGLDDYRYEEALRFSRLMDKCVSITFKSLIALENKGFIKLSKIRN